MREKKVRKAHVIFKRQKDAIGLPVMDLVFGSEDRAYDRLKKLRGWGYECCIVETETNPSEDDEMSDRFTKISELPFR